MTNRFILRLSKLGNGMITDTQKKEDLYFDKEFLDATLPKTTDWLNELNDENEQLKSTSHYMLNWIQNKCPKYYKYFKRIVRGDVRIDDVNARLMQEVSEYSRKAKELEKENEQLKSDLKELHEICAYYEHRIKELKEDGKND